MDIKKLNFFIHVAELGSLTRASISLGMEQSTLSRHIRALEEELRVPLFARDGRGVNITPAGEKLLARSRKIMGELAMLTHDLAVLTEEPTGRLKLGLPPTVADLLSARLITRFAELCPRMTLEIVEGMSGNLYEWLTGDRLDAAVLYLVPATRNLLAEPLISEPLVFCTHPRRSAGLAKELALTDLRGIPLALPATSHGLRSVVEAAAKKVDATLTIRYDVNSVATIKQMVGENVASSVLPLSSVSREAADGSVATHRIIAPELVRTLLLANGAQVTRTDPLRHLNSLIKDTVKAMAPRQGWKLCDGAEL